MIPIVFYDGECGFCQQNIRLLHRLDSKSVLRFAPIGGKTYKDLNLHPERLPQWATYSHGALLFLQNDELSMGFEAVKAILQVINPLLFAGVCAVPTRLGRLGYNQIAKRRQWLQRSCPQPSKSLIAAMLP